MKYKNQKKGISLIILIVTITVAIILAVAVVTSLDSSIRESRLNGFAYEIATIEDAVKSYYISEGTFPKDLENEQQEFDNINSVKYLYKLDDEFLEETALNNDTNNSFFVVDLSMLEAQNININQNDGNTEEKKFICAYPSFNVYSLKGISVNGTKYYSITSKIDEKIKKNVLEKENTSEVGVDTRSKINSNT